jgi:ATP-dependent Clp protease ATP-binding subunit ClpA
MALTPRATQIIALAERRATELGQERAGAEHLLLALSEEPHSVAVRVLNETAGADVVRDKVLAIIREPGYLASTRAIADADGRPIGEVVTDDEGNDVFVDLEGNPRPWPTNPR